MGDIEIFSSMCRKVRDVEKTDSWRSETPETLKFVAILEADPNDDEFNRVKSAAD